MTGRARARPRAARASAALGLLVAGLGWHAAAAVRDDPPDALPPGAVLGAAPMGALDGAPVHLPSGPVSRLGPEGPALPRPPEAVPGGAPRPVPPARAHAATPADEPPPAPPAGATLPVAAWTLPDARLAFADGQLAAASAALAPPAVPGGFALSEENGTLRFTLGTDVLFDFDRAVLRPEARPVLRRLMGEVAARVPSGRARFRVEGHTDWIGSDAYNQRLSERRAAAVRAWLSGEGGVPGARVGTAGFGESRPVAPNARPDGADDPEGRQRNRRVEIVVTPG